MLIDGPDSELLTVRREHGRQLPHLHDGGIGDGDALSLTIENGDAGTSGGGGVLNADSGMLAILSSVVTATAPTSGGGIHNDVNGRVTVIASVVQGNSFDRPRWRRNF